MKNLLIALGFFVIAVPLIFAPINIQISSDKNWNNFVKIEQNLAYAGKSKYGFSKKSFRSSTKKKNYGSFTNKKKKNGFATQPSGLKKTYEKGKDPFSKSTSVAKKSTNKAKAPKAKLSAERRNKLSKIRASDLTSKSSRTIRLKTQTARTMKMRSMSRLQVRAMRSDRNYWRSRAQYERNLHYRNYNRYGWGYGYYPGYTYHRGWGRYGYGYTRDGLNIVDAMILYSLFGNEYTSDGTAVINNYYIDGEEVPGDVVVVPQGSYLEGFGLSTNPILIIKNSDGDVEQVPVPAESTIQIIAAGTLIQTPDGTGVFIPMNEDEYNAEPGYQIPDNAAQPQEYAEFAGNISDDENSAMLWLIFSVVALILITLFAGIVRIRC